MLGIFDIFFEKCKVYITEIWGDPMPFTTGDAMPNLSVSMASRGERVNYLSLALQARSAIKRLKLLMPPNKPTPELKSALHAVLNSLTETKAREGFYSRLYDEGGFSRFEEIQTVEEVIHTLEDSNPRNEIERILTGQTYTEEDLRAAIRFFSALENRALYHYDDPSLSEALR
jgi:hypothetical protein